MCVFPVALRKPRTDNVVFPRRPTNTLEHHSLADGQLSSLYQPSSKVNSFFAASVIVHCTPLLASSSTHLRPSECYPSIILIVNITHLRVFCYHQFFYTFAIRLVSSSQPGTLRRECSRLVVSPPSLFPSRCPKCPPRRWPALITFPPCDMLQRVYADLCEALLSSSCLVNQTHRFLLPFVCLKVVDITVVSH